MRKLIVLLTLTGLAACSGEAPVSSDTTASQSQQPQVGQVVMQLQMQTHPHNF